LMDLNKILDFDLELLKVMCSQIVEDLP